MSSISAGTAAGAALVQTGDTTGQLVIKTGSSAATAATFNADQTTTLAQPLPVASGGTGATTLSGITVGNATNATSATNATNATNATLATTATNIAGGSNGTIPYQSASGTTQMLAVGTSGQVLKSNGVAAPSWITPSSGALVYLSTVTASSSATVDVETTFNSTYRAYLIIGTGVLCSSSSPLNCRLKIGGSYITTASYAYSRHDLRTDITSYEASSDTGGSTVPLTGSLSTSRSADFMMTVYFPSDTVSEKMFDWRFAPGRLNNNVSTGSVGYASNSNTDALTGVRFYFGTGNVASGEFRLYGIANS